MDLILRPEAERDLAEAADWYREQDAAVRDRFVAKVEAVFERIARSPRLFTPSRGNTRRAAVRGFPYSVYFRVEDSRIVVFAVLHQRRDDGLLNERLN